MAVVRAGLSAVMVGRAAQSRRLEALARDLTEPRVALISGEAGVGKSRLVREFVASLGDLPVFVGHAEPEPAGRPFHVLQSALRPAVASWSAVPEPLLSRSQALRVLLRPVAPGLDGTSPAEPRVAGDENFVAAVDLMRCLLDGRPGVLVAEDLHWADAESLLLLARLATTPDLPLLVIGTFRPMVEDRRLGGLLDRVARQRMVEQIALAPLDEGQIAEWLGAVYHVPVPWRAASDLARRTSGNPFFLEELVASAPDASVDELVRLPLPVSVSEAVLRHLEGLDASQRRIADAAAVLGRRVPFDLLAAVTGSGEDELIDALRELVGRGALIEVEPDIFSFRHALTREAIAHRLLGRQRRRLHEKAHAALLEMGSDDWGALAYHASGANLWDDVVDAARRGAGVHLRTGSTYEALRLAELGLQEADSDRELVALATRAAWACGLSDAALGYASQWVAIVEAGGDDAERSRALRTLSRLRWEAGDRDGRDDAVERLLAVAERMPEGADLAEIFGHISEVRLLYDQPEEAVAWADRAIALGALDHCAALPAALVNKGSALLDMAGHFDDGAALLEQAIDVAVEQGDVLSALRGVNNLAQAALVRWPPERVWALLERGRSLMDRFGWQDRSLDEAIVSYHLEALGDVAAGRALLDDALRDPVVTRAARRTWTLIERAWLAAEVGEPGAVAMIEDARSSYDARWIAANSAAADWLASIEIEAAVRSGDAAAAEEALGQIEKLAGSITPTCNFDVWGWGSGLLAALRAGVEPRVAASVFETMLAAEKHGDRDQDAGWRAHIGGAVAAAMGDHATAVERYLDALARPRRRPGVVVEADARVSLAKSLIALGDLPGAREHVDEAARLLSRWEGWRLDEVDALRRRLTAGGERAAVGQLTARERDVAELVRRGLSNGEIGRALYISTKTASVHVSNILAKLGMSSRAQIAAWASSTEFADDAGRAPTSSATSGRR